jgi:hypothetical protein
VAFACHVFNQNDPTTVELDFLSSSKFDFTSPAERYNILPL